MQGFRDFIVENLRQFEMDYFILFDRKEQEAMIDVIVQEVKQFSKIIDNAYVMDWREARKKVDLKKETIVTKPDGSKVYRLTGKVLRGIPLYSSTSSFRYARKLQPIGSVLYQWCVLYLGDTSPTRDLYEIDWLLGDEEKAPLEPMARAILDSFPGFKTGEDVNGGDLVDFISGYLAGCH